MIMKKVKVTIDRHDNIVTVCNDKGKKWKFFCEDKAKVEHSNTACVATVATSMLMATINSHLQHSNADKLVYTLTVEPDSVLPG